MREISIDMIPIGKENAITRQSLCFKTGLSDDSVRDGIRKLRRNGSVILSSPKICGYWIPNTYEELTDFIDTMESYAKACFMARDSAMKLLKEKDQKKLGLTNAICN